VTSVADHTGFPNVLDGRAKTLHLEKSTVACWPGATCS
jgi:AICAR transformylase/IMP cyclohydrolase PurH